VKNNKDAEDSLECTGKIGLKKYSKMTELWMFSGKYLEKSTFSEKYFGHFVNFSSFVGRFKDFKSWNRILQDLLLYLMGFKVFVGRRKT